MLRKFVMGRSFNATLDFYLMRVFTLNFLMLLFALLSIVYLFDTVELLRRAAKFEGLSLMLVLQMGLLKLPETGQQIFPFVVLFSAMYSFWQLSRRHELIILRSAGLSVWQFTGPFVFVAMLIGILHMSVINPMSAQLMKRFENLESVYLNKESNLISLTKQGLWLRQQNEQGVAVLHAADVKMPEWTLRNVIVFFFDQNFNFQRRIDTKTASLNEGQWRFNDAVVNAPQSVPEKSDFILMATDLTIDEIEESFSDPQTISFWQLPGFIQIMQATGFDAKPLQVHFQNLLSMPLLFVAMVFLAAAVSLRPPRRSGTFLLVIIGIALGFTVFFLSNFLLALGASNQIPVFVSAWFPAIITFLLGIGYIMTQEDG